MRDQVLGRATPRGAPAGPCRKARGRPSRTVAAAVVVLAVAAWTLASPVRVAAEPRTVVGVRFASPGGSGFGVDLEVERPGASSWLVGLSLAPTGAYGGFRSYTKASGDRPFYGAYVSLTDGRWGYLLGAWFSGGYEVQFDPKVRGTGEVGFGLRARPDGELEPELFVSLSLGLKR